MEVPGFECVLERAIAEHGIGAEVFSPFAIARLRGADDTTGTLLNVSLRNIWASGTKERILRLSWSPTSALQRPMAVQEYTVTEWAALGVGLAALWTCLGLRASQVALEGDRFDYWIRDGESEYGLEVSGTLSEEVEERHHEKVRQLRANPYGVDGYVIVVGFVTRTLILSLNRFGQEFK